MALTIAVSGSPYERGRQHGEAASELIRTAHARWSEVLDRDFGITTEQLVREMTTSAGYLSAIGRWAPEILDEIRGIADGSGQPLETTLVYNWVDEQWAILRHYMSPRTVGTNNVGCTAVGVAKASGVLIAQNLDVPVYWQGSEVLLDVRSPEAPRALVVATAGMIGCCGLNEAGVGVCCNTLASLHANADGLPVSAVLRLALTKSSLAEVRDALTSVTHASGQNYLVGDVRNISNFECSGHDVIEMRLPERGPIWHTNHPLANTDFDPEAGSSGPGSSDSSLRRGSFVASRLTGHCQPEDIKALLADRTVPVSIVPEDADDAYTFASIVMQLGTPTEAEIAFGPPGRNAFSRYTLEG